VNYDDRLDLLLRVQNDPVGQELLLQQCAEDPVFWINTFVWTFDPRVGGPLPFVLYPFQVELLLNLKKAIENGGYELVEKSRDMGVSWLILTLFQWFWRFRNGNTFLLGSYKEDYVDKRGDMDSLFEKLRFVLRNQPAWMLPSGWNWKQNSSSMLLQNPDNGNTLTGETAVADFGRAGRHKAILLDEFPRWPFDNASLAACRDTSPCRIMVGTPFGKSNRFARARLGKTGEKVNIHTVHWRLHPEKDDAWYETQKGASTPAELAREVDIDYNLSTEEVVFSEFNAALHLMKTPWVYNRELETIDAFDFGTTCAVLYAQVTDDDRLMVFKEVVLLNNGNTEDLAEWHHKMVARYDMKTPYHAVDPAGKANVGLTHVKNTHHLILESNGIGPLNFRKAEKMKKRREEGVALMKRLFTKRVGGQEQILIDPEGCPLLVEALMSEYKYKTDANGERSDEIDEKHPYEDIVDCLRYIVIEKFGVEPDEPEQAYYDPGIVYGV
jgi:hypothetical protein